MSDEQALWLRVEAALDVVLALPAAERHAAAERLGGDDPRLRSELTSLLAQVDGDDPTLDRPRWTQASAAPAPAGSLAPGTRIGAYRLVELIGRGGMGEVYRADRADGQYDRQVALKLVRQEMAGDPSRFQAERQTLAMLDHPGIARLLDGGVAPDGRPYMVMELVSGRNIVEWCRDRSSPLAERLALFAEVCQAVEYAHRNLIVHRDLKPANVLVGADGTVRLLDFGVAKLLGSPDAALTRDAPLTPDYAAPEQLLHGAITTATDVYALGMLLFELLTGTRPWNVGELPLVVGLERILRDTPPAPSAVAAGLPDAPVAPKLLRGDLDAIVAKALRKEPEHRYVTVTALREDVERSRRHEPVAARDGTRLYLAGRLLRRHRALVAGIAALLVAILGGAAATLWQAHATRLEAQRADAVRDFLIDIFEHNTVNNPDGAKARQTTAEQLLDIGAERIRTGLRQEPAVRNKMFDVLTDLYVQLEKYDRIVDLERLRLAEIRAAGDRPSPEKAVAEAKLGNALVMLGAYPEAFTQLQAALRTMNDIGDRTSEQYVNVLLALGRIAYHRAAPGDMPVARHYAEETIRAVDAGDPRNPDRLFAMQLLARIAEQEGRAADAERDYRSVAALAEQPQFREYPALIAHGYDDLGSFLLDRRRYDEAEPELRRALQLFAAAEGEQQMDTAIDRAYLGQLLVAKNRGAEGEALLERALGDMEQTQGRDNIPSTATLRFRFARTELERGRLAAAAALLDENLAKFAALDPQNHKYYPLTLQASAQLAMVRGRPAEAAALLDRADALWPEDAPDDGSRRAMNRVLRARLALLTGHFGADDEAAVQAIRSRWPAGANDLPPVFVAATLVLGDARLHAGQPRDASALAQALVVRIGADPGHDYLADWEARARSLWGESLLRLGDAGAARDQLEAAVALRRKFDDAGSPYLADAVAALARAESLKSRGGSGAGPRDGFSAFEGERVL